MFRISSFRIHWVEGKGAPHKVKSTLPQNWHGSVHQGEPDARS